jgi:hypothetical protein
MDKPKIVSIHQPDFFPWMGFFNKIFMSDVFVIFDTGQIPNKKSSYTNRVKLVLNGESRWGNTIPITKGKKVNISIKDVEIVEGMFHKKKFLKTLHFYYKKAPFYKNVIDFIEHLILFDNNNLCEYNLNSIYHILDKVGINKNKIVLASELAFKFEENKDLNIRISEIVKKVNGDIYLSGNGSVDYMNEQIFKENKIKLKYQNFIHPNYPQFNTIEFQSGVSIIDAFMNIGFKGVHDLINIS